MLRDQKVNFQDDIDFMQDKIPSSARVPLSTSLDSGMPDYSCISARR